MNSRGSRLLGTFEHDIPDGIGNWDYIGVGPGGVFAIDSKNLA